MVPFFQMVSTLQAQPPVTRNSGPNFEPRLVFPLMKKSGDLGVRLVKKNSDVRFNQFGAFEPGWAVAQEEA